MSILIGWDDGEARARALDGFDDDHPAAATGGIGATGRSFIPAGLGQRLADAVDVAGANGAVEEAVVMMWTASPERHQVPRRGRWRSRIGKPSMKSFIRIGIDLAKNFFQVHAIEREGAPAVTRKLSRGKVLGFFRASGALPRGHGGLRLVPLLGARDPGVGA